ncbi:MAG: pyruvate formate-lyase-activating protein [Collinsella sp.]
MESCGTVDGPGIRFVLFLSGCSLRCRYCHNPDASYVRRGQTRSAADILEELARYRDFLQAAGGGLTLSGGDPLFQPAFAKAVLKGGKAMGLHTCLDTSGHLGANADGELLEHTDLVLLDIKAWNPERYRNLTGGELRPTLESAERLAALRKPVWLRYVLVPGLTDDMEDMAQSLPAAPAAWETWNAWTYFPSTRWAASNGMNWTWIIRSGTFANPPRN